MTVSELIEELKKLPPDAVVWLAGDGVMASRADHAYLSESTSPPDDVYVVIGIE